MLFLPNGKAKNFARRDWNTKIGELPVGQISQAPHEVDHGWRWTATANAELKDGLGNFSTTFD
jgi:hypothetical protein